MRRIKGVRWRQGLAGVILISAFAGCQREEAKVYHIPKEDSPPSQPAPEATPDATSPDVSSPPDAPAPSPQLKYQLPEDWQEKPPTEMRVASFTALGPNGQSADVSVTPLPLVGRDLELINMWRSQVQLPATTDPDAAKQAEPVMIGAEQGRLFEFVSEQPMLGKLRQRILVAIVTRGTMSWFFKMTGEDAFVTAQKEKFLQFLKTVSFEDGAPVAAPAATQGENESAGSIWTLPPGWQSVPPSQFLLAEFSISGPGGGRAEVNVAEMSGEVGGLLANVNRWRGQIGLDAVSENDLSQLAQVLDVPDGSATLVDFVGKDAKTGAPTELIGAMMPLNGQMWFYKLMGDKQIVAQQKDAFTKFIQSANYANAR